MVSSRLPSNLETNELTRLLERQRRDGIALVDLTESNPTRAGIDYDPGLLAALASPASLVYEPQPLGLAIARDAVAREHERRGLHVPASRIVLTSSTSEAYSWLFKLLCNPGDRVLVPAPSYPLFEYLARLDVVEVAAYALHFDGRWSVDVEAVRHGVTPNTRAILLVNPNNPTGSYVSTEDLDALRGICRTHRLALISDEVFGDYAFDPSRVTSALDGAGRDDAHEALTFALGGLSKSAGLPQLKLGWMAVGGPPSEVAAALAGLEIIGDTYLSVATPVQQAAPSLLEAGRLVRERIQLRTRHNLDTLTLAVAVHPSIALLPPEGGWYAVVRVPRIVSEEELVTKLLAEHQILVHPGYFFDFAHEAFLVLSLLPPPDVFAPAVRRLLAVAAGG